MHPAKQKRIDQLIHTSVDDARSSLELMLKQIGADYALEIASGALLRLESVQAKQVSHRKLFATIARKAIKQLEAGPLA